MTNEDGPYIGKPMPLVGVEVAYGKALGGWDHRTQRYLPGPGRPKGSGKRKDLTGQVFGRLTVMGEAPMRNAKRYWLCECECGNLTEARQDNLLRWRTEGCGCQKGRGGRGVPRNRKPAKWSAGAKAWMETGDPSKFLDAIEAGEGKEARAGWEALIARLTPETKEGETND
ncbi:hypothetical protein [Nocardioides sp.]|uniref:hypothetical protein n=1 Tax=Nocardioides sp. TaxID=35761 RepID=UPI002C79E205|nr:hypothetical protein [Nocardioides sp.]HSX68461.1 hypothetical protein [Nocardioides sp.]